MPLHYSPKAEIANKSVVLDAGDSHELSGQDRRPWFITRGRDDHVHRISFVTGDSLLHLVDNIPHHKNFQKSQPESQPTPKTHPKIFLPEDKLRILFPDSLVVLGLTRDTAGKINAVIRHGKPSLVTSVANYLGIGGKTPVKSSPICVTRGGVVFEQDRTEAHEIQRMSFDMTTPFIEGQQGGYCDLKMPKGTEVFLKIPSGALKGALTSPIILASAKKNDNGEIVVALKETLGNVSREVKVTAASNGIHLPELGMKATLLFTKEGQELLRLEYFKPTTPLVVEV